jgi:hypothetical protein
VVPEMPAGAQGTNWTQVLTLTAQLLTTGLTLAILARQLR